MSVDELVSAIRAPGFKSFDYSRQDAVVALGVLGDRCKRAERERDEARDALEVLLAWAERTSGGDPSLDPEEWYIARDYARIALATEDALQRPTSGCPPPESSRG